MPIALMIVFFTAFFSGIPRFIAFNAAKQCLIVKDIWVGVGFGKTVLEGFFELLTNKQKANIKAVSGDGAGWIKDTVEANCPNAVFCIDPFHVV